MFDKFTCLCNEADSYLKQLFSRVKYAYIYLLGTGWPPASGTLKSNLNKATTENNQIIKSNIPQTKLNIE